MSFFKCVAVCLVTLSFIFGQERATLKGTLTHLVTGEPIPFADIRIESLHRLQTTDTSGKFTFENIPFGVYEISANRIGYDPLHIEYEINKKNHLLTLQLHPSHLSSDEVLVESSAYKKIVKPALSVSGKSLRKNLSSTIAETITNEPGISFRSMGAAPARPVLRGLGGDRLLVLEDNTSAGDMSATSADHAVAIDPMTSDHIDVVRGPESILFGSNTMGGVVNVIRGAIPEERVSGFEGTSSVQGTSASSSFAIGQSIELPVQSFVLRLDGSYRKAENMQSPKGEIENSLLQSGNASIGGSYFSDWGFLGTSFNIYDTDYGIPPDPFTGHASGVTLDMKRTQFKTKLNYHLNHSVFNGINVQHTMSKYQHKEIERSLNAIGQSYSVITHDVTVSTTLNSFGSWKNGTIGSVFGHRDYKTGGLSNTPATKATSGAMYAYIKHHYNHTFEFDGSVRYDYKQITPFSFNEIGSTGLAPTERSFHGLSGGISGTWNPSHQFSARLNFIKTFRPPTLEDLFSDGPHLANYTFEVGNPSLEAEHGYSSELSVSYKKNENLFKLTGYYNTFTHFIFTENTGHFSKRIASLYEYQYVGKDARMYGAEFQATVLPTHYIKLDARLGTVFGELLDEEKPLPYMPPLEGVFSASYEHEAFSVTASAHFAGKQNRIHIPDVLFQPSKETDLAVYKSQRNTSGYVVYDIGGEYHFMHGGLFHTFTLTVSNVFNKVYQKHLNRIKHIFPEPKRDIKLLYKVYF